MRKPAGVKIWMRSRLFGASATTNVPFGSTANAVGSMIRPGFGADLHDLPRARLLLVDAVDRVAAAIEDEVLAGGRLLKAGRLAETAGDVRGHGADRAQHVRR